jgi:hypothetical protein
MDEKPAWIPTWNEMNNNSWAAKNCVKPTSKKWISYKSRRP